MRSFLPVDVFGKLNLIGFALLFSFLMTMRPNAWANASCNEPFAENSSEKVFSSYKPISEDGVVTTTKEVPLSSKALLEAYANGMYPWSSDSTGFVKWYNPKVHAVIDMRQFFPKLNPYRDKSQDIVDGNQIGRASKAVNKVYQRARKYGWTVTFNNNFRKVIESCRDHDRRSEEYQHVWLVDSVVEAFVKLHEEGHAHSIEVWNKDGELIGGAYGLYQKGLFSGESMFHTESNAAQFGIFKLMEHLLAHGHIYYDTMVENTNTRHHFKAYSVDSNNYVQAVKDISKWYSHNKDNLIGLFEKEPLLSDKELATFAKQKIQVANTKSLEEKSEETAEIFSDSKNPTKELVQNIDKLIDERNKVETTPSH